jgi:hypothetical protein
VRWQRKIASEKEEKWREIQKSARNAAHVKLVDDYAHYSSSRSSISLLLFKPRSIKQGQRDCACQRGFNVQRGVNVQRDLDVKQGGLLLSASCSTVTITCEVPSAEYGNVESPCPSPLNTPTL